MCLFIFCIIIVDDERNCVVRIYRELARIIIIIIHYLCIYISEIELLN